LGRDVRGYTCCGVDKDAQAGRSGAAVRSTPSHRCLARPGESSSETNDSSVAILLSYSRARVLLAGDAETREKEYMANGPHLSYTSSTPTHKNNGEHP
jgi:beta-lactamase superfamily II metal-dependent hydrolase